MAMVEYILAVEQITNKNMTILEELLLLVVQVSDDTENFQQKKHFSSKKNVFFHQNGFRNIFSKKSPKNGYFFITK